ncbi:MAG: OmpA family protein [Silicimonas sp.]|nr:OmpA family protein [Silicimonas sp.]
MTSQSPLFRSPTLAHVLAIALGATACLGVAVWAKRSVEALTLDGLSLSLSQAGHDWAEVDVDGLSVTLRGTAADEATRFAALSAAGRVVDASRIIDNMDVEAAAAIKAPDFSIELLKNDGNISLIGLVPTLSDPERIVARVGELVADARISPLLETAQFEAPPGWDRALAFGIEALEVLPSSKVSISARRVTIEAVAEDADDKADLERRLKQKSPPGLAVALRISAPRPVVAPFTLRFLIDDGELRFDACTADSAAARAAIIRAARQAGVVGDITCPLALGTPSTRWGEAAVAGIQGLRAMGEGTLTLSNADVTLVAREGTSPALFERTAAELEAALPPVFSLSAILPETPDAGDGPVQPPEFTAIRSPEGQVQLRGRLGDAQMRAAVESYAAAQFGADSIYSATRLDGSLPGGWPLRVLTALEAMGHLHHGVTSVTAESISISGETGAKDAQAQMARILSGKLPDGAAFDLNVTYSEQLDPLSEIPTPEECLKRINAAGAAAKITFAPSSTEIEAAGVKTIDAISEILRDCKDVAIEIGGHTDSQGRESMNNQLSQARADAVLNAIMARRVLVSNLTAKGYGESQPIADNKTEAGRETNRRIEFRLIEDNTEEAETPETPEGDSTE